MEIMIQKKQASIDATYQRMHQQVAVKDRELQNTKDRLSTAKKELNSLQKRSAMTEADKIIALEEKIRATLDHNKELSKEVKLLKKQQKHQGNTLVNMEDPNSYPTKIKNLMEETRIAKEKSIELKGKIR